MKVLIIASENSPYAQVGGLSQAISFLARAVSKQGIDARVFMPKYGVIDQKKYAMEMDTEALAVPTGSPKKGKNPSELICNVKFRSLDDFYAPTYFLENREYFELRANVYGYSDEHTRFALLSFGCLEWILQNKKKKNAWVPEVIHTNDWHAGYLIEAIKKNPRYKRELSGIKILYTIHNFRHQGNINFRYADKQDDGKKELYPILDPRMRLQNPMLRGIIYADQVNTVSMHHAQEVQTKEFGEGLDKYLREYAYKLSGIANGIDTIEMNPETDKNITRNFSIKNIKDRNHNKAALQRYFKLPVAMDVPIFSYIGRLAPQKGIEIILQVLDHIESLPKCQFIFLGSGAENYYEEIKKMTERYPTRVAAFLQRDFIIPRKIFAGSDFLLVPSLFEPGGIVAMEALRYGCVPIVANTGGLSETIQGFDINTYSGNGFLHEPKDTWSFYASLIQGLTVFGHTEAWQALVRNALACDFSWDKTAEKYIELYKKMLKK